MTTQSSLVTLSVIIILVSATLGILSIRISNILESRVKILVGEYRNNIFSKFISDIIDFFANSTTAEMMDELIKLLESPQRDEMIEKVNNLDRVFMSKMDEIVVELRRVLLDAEIVSRIGRVSGEVHRLTVAVLYLAIAELISCATLGVITLFVIMKVLTIPIIFPIAVAIGVDVVLLIILFIYGYYFNYLYHM
jgi:ABC-type multidrug transport system fused ATPase/permease subunit